MTANIFLDERDPRYDPNSDPADNGGARLARYENDLYWADDPFSDGLKDYDDDIWGVDA